MASIALQCDKKQAGLMMEVTILIGHLLGTC